MVNNTPTTLTFPCLLLAPILHCVNLATKINFFLNRSLLNFDHTNIWCHSVLTTRWCHSVYTTPWCHSVHTTRWCHSAHTTRWCHYVHTTRWCHSVHTTWWCHSEHTTRWCHSELVSFSAHDQVVSFFAAFKPANLFRYHCLPGILLCLKKNRLRGYRISICSTV